MITFEQAREAVRRVNEPEWEAQDMPGTYMVAKYGKEDAEFFLVVDGAKESLEDDDDEFTVMDAPVMLVDKVTGAVVEGNFLDLADRLAAMTPIGDYPTYD